MNATKPSTIQRLVGTGPGSLEATVIDAIVGPARDSVVGGLSRPEPISPATANYLRATRRLAEAAKAMSPRVSILRTEVGQAQAAWVNAGCPDCPPEMKGAAFVFVCGGER